MRLYPLCFFKENLEVFFEEVGRINGWTHFFDDDAGGSVHGMAKGDLSDFGIWQFQR